MYENKNENAPLILFPDVILFAQVDEVGNRLGGEKGHRVNDIYLLVVPLGLPNILVIFC